jgi:hypothetical protein
MRKRAFVMLDALGFKGIWKKHKPSVVLYKMNSIKAAIDDDLKRARLKGVYKDSASVLRKVSTSFLSDTIIIEVQTKPLPGMSEEITNGLAILIAMLRASAIIQTAVETEPRLLYRGTAAFGRCTKMRDFVIGPAVDEVAATMNLAQGALVWLAPSAIPVWKAGQLVPEPNPLVPYAVPLKNGDRLDSLVLDATTLMSRAEADAFTANVDAAFDSPVLDHQVKRQNTLRFLKQCIEDPRRTWEPAKMVAVDPVDRGGNT